MNKKEAGKLGWIAGIKYREENKKRIRDQYYSNPKLCKNCNKVISYENQNSIFCCKKCWIEYLRKNSKKEKFSKKIICLNCGKEHVLHSYNSKGKFCSNKCCSDFKIKENFQQIEKLGYFKNDINARKQGKRFLLHKYGHKCQICGISEWLNKPILLILDHIDGNHSNNKIENCRLICSNCDATLQTYKRKNKYDGKKRINRK